MQRLRYMFICIDTVIVSSVSDYCLNNFLVFVDLNNEYTIYFSKYYYSWDSFINTLKNLLVVLPFLYNLYDMIKRFLTSMNEISEFTKLTIYFEEKKKRDGS
jgi:hypothetical protein